MSDSALIRSTLPGDAAPPDAQINLGARGALVAARRPTLDVDTEMARLEKWADELTAASIRLEQPATARPTAHLHVENLGFKGDVPAIQPRRTRSSTR